MVILVSINAMTVREARADSVSIVMVQLLPPLRSLFPATLQHLLPTCTLPILLHQNSSGNTPLHWAGLNGHLALCKALVYRIEELERANPEQAETIKAEHRRQEEEAKAKKAQRENRGDGSTTTAEAEEEARSNDQAALRSIWDVRNTFGRGPTSESQMNDREDVVQYLLLAMGGGADVKPGKSDEAVPDEDQGGKSQEKAAQSAGGQGTGGVRSGAVDDVQKKTAALNVVDGEGEEQAPSTTSS